MTFGPLLPLLAVCADDRFVLSRVVICVEIEERGESTGGGS
jgi:hypothetical protein